MVLKHSSQVSLEISLKCSLEIILMNFLMSTSMVFFVQLSLLLAQCSALGESGLQPHLGHLLLFSLGQAVHLILRSPHVGVFKGLAQLPGHFPWPPAMS